jgi:hypothetical protein
MKKQNSLAYLEAKGMSKVWAAYAEHYAAEEIMEEGFNPNSGYVYIALENGITIASSLGQDVEYLTYNFDNDEEIILDSFEKLQIYLMQENHK